MHSTHLDFLVQNTSKIIILYFPFNTKIPLKYIVCGFSMITQIVLLENKRAIRKSLSLKIIAFKISVLTSNSVKSSADVWNKNIKWTTKENTRKESGMYAKESKSGFSELWFTEKEEDEEPIVLA